MASSHLHRTPGVPIFKILLFLGVVLVGAYLRISTEEWSAILITTGLIICAEGFYFAAAGDLNQTSYHPFAHNSKDIAAGAVVMSMLAAVIIWLAIFAPYLGY